MKSFRFSRITSFVVGTVLVGATTVLAVPNPYLAHEPEYATKTGAVATVPDGSASNGSVIRFGEQLVGCPGEPNTPGGEDPYGGCWPGEHNTGWPHGELGDTRTPVTLTPYTGPCSINTDNVVIDSKEVNCERLRITADNVTIVNSLINCRIDTPDPMDPQYSFSFTLTDSSVAVGDLLGEKAVKLGNMVLTRADITGTSNSVTCTANCTIIDSWLHDQATDPEGILHVSALRQGNGGLYRHNSIICEAARGQGAGGACSGAITGYGDQVVVQNNLIENNLILAGTASICVYGGSGNGRIYADQANNIRFLNNIFSRGASGRCGTYALIAAWRPDLPGNVFAGNTYLEDGAPALDTD